MSVRFRFEKLSIIEPLSESAHNFESQENTVNITVRFNFQSVLSETLKAARFLKICVHISV